jgi:hypothetical protein
MGHLARHLSVRGVLQSAAECPDPLVFTLEDLKEAASAFDAISDEDLEGARFKAEVFVVWLRGEVYPRRIEPAGRPRRKHLVSGAA